MRAYYSGFTNKKSIEDEFDVKLPANLKILYAAYGMGSYQGDATVVCQIGKKLYEVHGSHCSCYGLEGQWDLEPTSLVYLKKVAKNVNLMLGSSDYSDLDRLAFVKTVAKIVKERAN